MYFYKYFFFTYTRLLEIGNKSFFIQKISIIFHGIDFFPSLWLKNKKIKWKSPFFIRDWLLQTFLCKAVGSLKDEFLILSSAWFIIYSEMKNEKRNILIGNRDLYFHVVFSYNFISAQTKQRVLWELEKDLLFLLWWVFRFKLNHLTIFNIKKEK